MQFEPGSKWSYCQSGINVASRIVEIVSGLVLRCLRATAHPRSARHEGHDLLSRTRSRRRIGSCLREEPNDRRTRGRPAAERHSASEGHPPAGQRRPCSLPAPTTRGSAKCCSTDGTLDGKRYLSPGGDEAADDGPDRRLADRLLPIARSSAITAPTTAGASAPASCGRRTRAWPRCSRPALLVMAAPGAPRRGSTRCAASLTSSWCSVSNFPNSDASEVRRAFQQAAAEALKK